MTWRPVTADEVRQVEAFLLNHIETSVFLVSNLRRFGPVQGEHPYSMTFWCTGDPIKGVIAQSRAGGVTAQWPEAGDWRSALAVLPGPITGFIGHGDQMAAALEASGLGDKPTNLYADETLFALDLANLILVDGPGALRPITEADNHVMIPWRTDYAHNILGEPEETSRGRAEQEMARYIEADSHRVLVDGDTYLSMTGFNGTVDDLVQIGGVYTPRERRGEGLARRAVALHLIEAREAGATRAILFANDPSAMAAYEAVGFKPIGRFLLVMFEEGHALQ